MNDYSFDPEGSVSIIDMTRRRSITDRRGRDDSRVHRVQQRGARPVNPDLRAGRDRCAGSRARVHRGVARFEDRVGHAPGEQRDRDHRPERRRRSPVSCRSDTRITRGRAGAGRRHAMTAATRSATGRSSGCTSRTPSRRSGGSGTTYLVTANEGDVREYDGLNDAGNEAVEIEDIDLDSGAFPDAATLQSRPLGIGRLKVTSFGGDTDGDGDYDRLCPSAPDRSRSGRRTVRCCSTAAMRWSSSPPRRSRRTSTRATRITRATIAATTKAPSPKASPWRSCSAASICSSCSSGSAASWSTTSAIRRRREFVLQRTSVHR